MFSFKGRDAKVGFCQDCTVLKGRVGLVNVDGTKIGSKNDIYIHHILTYDTTKTPNKFTKSCGIEDALAGAMGAKFIGSGSDNNNVDVWYTNREGDPKGGFKVGKADTFRMNADLVSYLTEDKEIYLTMELEYLKGTPSSLGDASETLLSVTECGGPSIKISSTGPTNTTSKPITFTESGTILGAKGHLHVSSIWFLGGYLY